AESESLGVPLARHLFTQALAGPITLAERAPRGLGHLACDVKHLKRRTGLAAACALKWRQRDFPTADITRRRVSVPSLHARSAGGLRGGCGGGTLWAPRPRGAAALADKTPAPPPR